MSGLILQHLLCFALVNTVVLVVGYALMRRKFIILSWIVFVTAVMFVGFLFIDDKPVIKMLAIIATTFMCMKVVAVTTAYKNGVCRLTFMQWVAFALGWAGMRPLLFEKPAQTALPNAWKMTGFGISRIIAGLLLVLLAHKIVLLPINQYLCYVLVSIILLIGLSLILHFGILSISAGVCRLCGINAYYLFKQPAKATSLAEFWSKRWNIAFSEMTAITVYRPLINKTGNTVALMVGFAFSGLLHEIALSVPVNSGYGLPMLYFILQGVLVLAERVIGRANGRLFNNKIIGRIWTFFWVIVPAPMLFHEAVIKQIVWVIAGIN